MTFLADKIVLKQLADGGFQLKIDTGEYAVKEMQEIIGLPKGVYRVTIEPELDKYA